MFRKNYWDLTDRPHTKLKLEIYRKYLDSWCAIFRTQFWAKDIYIIDCFAGKGKYIENGQEIDGSPLIAVKAAEKFQSRFENDKKKQQTKSKFEIHCRFIESNKKFCKELAGILKEYQGKVDYEIKCGYFKDKIFEVLREIGGKPALFFVDPYGIKGVDKKSIISIVNKSGGKDILFNYIEEGITRIKGLTKKCLLKNPEDITIKELKTISHLPNFLGDECIKLIGKSNWEILEYYVENVLKSGKKDKLRVVAFNMPYPHKKDTIYYLLFASRNSNAVKIVSQVYAKSKEQGFKGQASLFDSKIQMKIHK